MLCGVSYMCGVCAACVCVCVCVYDGEGDGDGEKESARVVDAAVCHRDLPKETKKRGGLLKGAGDGGRTGASSRANSAIALVRMWI